MDRKKKPPVDLPVKDQRKTPLTRTQSPIYDAPRLGNDGGGIDNPTDTNEGYLEPIQIMAPPDNDEYDYSDPNANSTVGIPDEDGYHEPAHVNVRGNKGRTSAEKIRHFFRGFTRNQTQNQGSHIYAEPQIAGQQVRTQEPSGYIDIQIGNERYSESVTSGGAIYSNDDQARHTSQDPVLASDDVPKSTRIKEYFRHLLPGNLKSHRWILLLVAIVILLVLIMIALAVYYTGFNNQGFSSKSCPSDQFRHASVGQSLIQVSWKEPVGLTRSHKSGDSFPVGETTVVTYVKEDEVVCNFTVTVDAEGRPPNQIVVDNVTSTTLSISWAIPSNTNPITDVPYWVYTINEYGEGKNSVAPVWRPVGSGLRALAYNLTDLVPGYGYTIIVSSPDLVANISGFVRTVPNQPGDITISPQVSSTSIRINWVPPSEGFFHKYRISYKSAGSKDVILAGLVPRSTTEYSILGLMASTRYDVFAEAMSGNVASKPRIYEDAMTATTVLQATEIGTNYITVRWIGEFDEDEGTLRLQIHGEKNLQFTIEVSGSTGEVNPGREVDVYMFADLDPGSLYRIQIFQSPTGENPLDVVYARTVPIPPGRSNIGMTPEITDKVVQASIQWVPLYDTSGQYDGFEIVYEPSDGHQASPIEVGNNTRQITIDGLDAGPKDYMVTVRTYSGMDYLLRTESEAISQTFTVPRIPENDFIMRRITNTTIKVIWNINDMLDDQKPMIIIQSTNGGHQTLKEVPLSDDKSENFYTFTGLTPGQTYNITGMTTMGHKLATAIITTVPNSVTGLRIKRSTPNSITLEWDQFETPYTHFEVICHMTCTKKTAMKEMEIGDLSPNTEYQFSVVTVSEERRSNATVISEYTTSLPP